MGVIVYTSLALATLLAILGSLHLLNRRFRRSEKLPPGPWPLPLIGNLHMRGKMSYQNLQKLATKYGPIMCLHLGQVPTIIVSSPEAAEQFLKVHDRAFAGRPKIQAMEHIYYDNKGFAFTTYGPHWQRTRRLCTTQLLSPLKITLQEPMRKEQLWDLVGKIKEAAKAREVLDLSAAVEQLVGEMVFRMTLGDNIYKKKKRISKLKALIDEALVLIGTFNLSDYMPSLKAFDLQGVTQRSRAIHESIDKILEEIIEEHETNVALKTTNYFVDVLLSMFDRPIEYSHLDRQLEQYSFDRTDIKAILLDVITGSYEASSIAINWALAELLRNPSTMSRLQEELEKIVGLDRMVEEADLPKLNYLEMVVKETLRLHPVAPLLIPHSSLEDVKINGYLIPKKSQIIINVAAIARDPKAWSSNAYEFIPERFVDSTVDIKGHNFKFIPFGAGRRVCPGISLGLTTVQFVLAQLVHCFKWELPHGMLPSDLDMSEKLGLACSRTTHLVLRPTYRLQSRF